MPEAIGTAAIEILPETTAFLPRAQAQVSSALAKVQASVTVEANVVTPPAAATGFAAMEQAAIAAKAAASGAGLSAEQQKQAMIDASHAAEEEKAALSSLRNANQEYSAVLKGQVQVENEDHLAKLRETRATEAQAAASRALTSITSGTTKEMVGEIEAATVLTERLNLLRASQEASAAAGKLQMIQSADTTKTIGAQALALTGFSGELTVAAIAAFALFESLQNRSDFEDHMNAIRSATKATDEQMKETEKTAIALGRDLNVPSASAIDAADAMENLVHAGFSLSDSQKLAKVSLLESAAATEDVGTAVGQVTGLVLAYHTPIAQAIEDTDALTAAQLAGVGSADQVAQALNQLGPSARSLGLDIRDVSTFLIQLGNEGIDAGTATSQLDSLFRRLAGNTAPVREGLAKIGLSVRQLQDEQGRLRPEGFVALSEILQKLEPQQRRQIEIQIASQRGFKALDTLVAQGLPGFEAAAERARELGATEEEAKVSAEGFGGQIRELQLTVSDLGTEIGKLSAGPALLLVKALNIAAGSVSDLVFGFGVLIDKSVELGQSLVGPIQKLGDIAGAAEDLIPGGEHITHFIEEGGKIALMGQALGPVGAAFSLLGRKASEGSEEGQGAMDDLEKSVEKNIDAIIETIKEGGEHIAHDLEQEFTAATKFMVDQATGASQEVLLADARLERQLALQRLARDRRRLREDPEAFGKKPGAAQARIQADAQAVTQARSEVNSILQEQAAQAQKLAQQAQQSAQAEKEAAAKIVAARQKHDQSVIASIGSEEARRQAAAQAAQESGSLQAQVRADIALRNFYRRSIALVRKQVEEAKVRAAELQTLRLAKAAVIREITRLRRQEAQEAASEREEQATLDEQILETRIGDVDQATARQRRRLIAAHQRVIAALKEEQSLVGRRTVEWKRLQLQIEQERAAIRDLKKTRQQEQADTLALQKQEFEFLQTIHGFDFSLLGNLIPGGIGGLVGGTTAGGSTGFTTATPTSSTVPGIASERPLSAFEHGQGHPPGTAATRARTGTTVRPVSAGQANTQIDWLRKIYFELHRSNDGTDHPEAAGQRRRGSASGDFSYRGTHGM